MVLETLGDCYCDYGSHPGIDGGGRDLEHSDSPAPGDWGGGTGYVADTRRIRAVAWLLP